MASKRVIINLSQNKKVNGDTNNTATYYDSATRRKIKVTKSNYPLGSDFLKYTHVDSVSNGGQFTLKEVLDDSGKKINTSGLKGVEKVTSVSAYYWKHEVGPDKKPGNVLIVEVVKKGHPKNETKYYTKSSGTPKWYPINGRSKPQQLDDNTLREKLDDLNCKRNNAVTIDLTNTHAKPGHSYCCYKHVSEKRVSVTSNKVSCSTHNGSAPFFKHEFTSGSGVQLAAIKYYGVNTPRKRIAVTDLKLPTKQSVKVAVYAFYSSDYVPVFIYVDSTGTKSNVTGWFQKGNGNSNGNEEWTQVKGLNNITPGDLGKIDCKDNGNFKELVTELTKLGCDKLEECTQKPKAAVLQPSDPPPVSAPLKSHVVSNSEVAEPAQTQHQEESETADSRETTAVDQPLALQVQVHDAFPWGIENILGAFVGVFTASCITTFASWKLYKAYQNYSDPWVRQI
ncbi:hypothetical protein BEWA_025510 [Theileria equi strain WA]|uniref:Uncharacterized protein n=1 Tax=Theileria equi strain WA TaxID=1537102 RepID=L0AVS0_THEEQ|nr:hypothetical protein BEWA_025510 [Theileria equi strain WA]AFZ79702.1 hypothetical protein BEWA_025510 [Theileria equi strain WA]|eukprot:XP_004829368.1 hypothetical protein BEWA_025510 [Theileria equi strain WA]